MKGLASLRRDLGRAGLDIVHPFRVDASLDDLFVFPRFDHAARLGVLVGNGRALWSPFLSWLATEPDLPRDPLNRYVTAALVGAFDALDVRHAAYFAHRLDYEGGPAGPGAVPLQRLGSRVGLASLGPAHLSVHPEHGPWFAYRAAVVLDLPPPGSEPPAQVEPCASCAAPCRAALERVLARGRPLPVAQNWQHWLAVRDACPVRPEARYSDAQIRYHYTEDPRSLGRTP